MVGVDPGTRIVRINISEGTDHASCMITFDAALRSTDLMVPHQDCHWQDWQVTSKGKIGFP